MDAARLKGMKVVSLGEGVNVGKVTDVLFERGALKASALQVFAEGSGSFIVPYDKLHSVGEDAITVESRQVAVRPSREGPYADLVTLEQIKGLKVVDEAGKMLGSIQTVDLDASSGQVQSVTVHRGGVLGLGGATTSLEPRAIRTIGTEIVTVATRAEEDTSQPHP